MTTTHAPTVQQSGLSSLTLWAARSLLFVLGVVGLAGATYFTFFAPPAEGGVVTPFDWFVAIWKMVVSLGMVIVALAPRMPQRRRLGVATWLLLADVVFGLVKLFGYQERESLVFFAINAVVLAVIYAARRQEQLR
jgi:FtsH-binding integral membrane protein